MGILQTIKLKIKKVELVSSTSFIYRIQLIIFWPVLLLQ